MNFGITKNKICIVKYKDASLFLYSSYEEKIPRTKTDYLNRKTRQGYSDKLLDLGLIWSELKIRQIFLWFNYSQRDLS